MGTRHDDQFAQLGQLALSAAILFAAIPAFMLSGNVDEIPASGVHFLSFIGIGVAVLGLGFVLIRLSSRRTARVIAALFAGYATSVYVTDTLFPVRIGPIETGQEVVHWEPLVAFVQIVLFAAFALLFLRGPRRLLGTFAWVGAGVLVIAGGMLVLMSNAQGTGIQAQAHGERALGANSFNIYHFILDAYTGPWLQSARAFSPSHF